jgi:hypothetical protein
LKVINILPCVVALLIGIHFSPFQCFKNYNHETMQCWNGGSFLQFLCKQGCNMSHISLTLSPLSLIIWTSKGFKMH